MERRGKSYYYSNRGAHLTLRGRDMRSTFQETLPSSASMRFFGMNNNQNLKTEQEVKLKKEKIVHDLEKREIIGKRVFHIFKKVHIEDMATQESSDDEGANLFQNEYLRQKIKNSHCYEPKIVNRKRVHTLMTQSARKKQDIFSITPEEKNNFLVKYTKEQPKLQKLLVAKSFHQNTKGEIEAPKRKHLLISFTH